MTLAERLEANVAKILIVDIERLPGLARAWDPKTRYIPISQFTRLPSLLCWAAKWYGSDEMMFESVWDDPARMVQRVWDLYDEADIVCTYNGIGFDNKHLRSDWLVAQMSPPAPWKDVDLYRINRATFGFESKSLQHLSERLGIAGKDGRYDAEMAEACVAGDHIAQATMRTYNEGDVRLTEQVYLHLLPWIRNHPHVAELPADDPDAKTCNRCGSADLERNGLYRAIQINYVRYRCRNCGANVRGTRHSRAALTHGV